MPPLRKGYPMRKLLPLLFAAAALADAPKPPSTEEALVASVPALLELRIDPDAITTRTSLTAIREKALQAGS